MIVYKFGGTALLNSRKAVELVKEALKEEKKVVVVCSAIGRYPYPYATDTLLKMSQNVSEKEEAMLVSCGEIISSVCMSDNLQKAGIKALALSPYDIDLTYHEEFKISAKVKDYFNFYDVLIIPGFIGLWNHEIVLLPRGGSNITACFLAFYFQAKLCIFSDVDGLYLENPRLHKNAKKCQTITTKKLRELVQGNPSLFPVKAIEYIEKGDFTVCFSDMNSKNGTIIRKS